MNKNKVKRKKCTFHSIFPIEYGNIISSANLLFQTISFSSFPNQSASHHLKYRSWHKKGGLHLVFYYTYTYTVSHQCMS